ncbi:rRNA methyltransferase [Sporosarcina luteola]|uniref:rRNA methyltransferase n=1 Tax=Sporosarcina luteola TaxID=582850 RepID=UPI00203CC540|nr:rRNA methyltransferase [Sporosarcina luteola]MCM3709685.1 rRNA methyltransferase [Sporosarcina luteola]MCM3743104.1 rRNA methyltransferase [Sporosarcina luteola]
MWKLVNGKLQQTSDTDRVKFRTNISKEILNDLNKLAEENDTHTNYLLESGLLHVLKLDVIAFNKDLRPKDRVQYKTTYDKELLEEIKKKAKDHNIFINDLIEHSVQFINIEESKSRNYRYRIEK